MKKTDNPIAEARVKPNNAAMRRHAGWAKRERDSLRSPSYFETARAALSITSATCLGWET